MKKLLQYLKGYRRDSVLGPLFKLLEATLELIVPLVIAYIIDECIGKDGGAIVRSSLLLLLLGLVGFVFSVTAQYFAARASVGFVTKVRHALFSHIGTLSYSDIDELGTPAMITRLTTDSSRVQTGLNLALRLLLRSPFVVFGAMIMAFTIDKEAGGTFAVVIPLLSLVIFGIMLISMPLYKKVQAGIDSILQRTRENLFGVRVIRAFNKEEDEISRFEYENDELTHKQKEVGKISALLNPLTYIIINLGIIALIHFGAIKVDAGNLTQGEVIALYNYMSQILVELIKLANLIISISKALASASRIAAVLEIRPSQSFGEATEGAGGEYAVEFDSVTLKYKKAAEGSLKDVSFKARRGEVVGIIGGTGSGKSTLVNLIPRFYDASEGQVRIFGTPIAHFTKNAILERVAIVPQKAVLFSGTIGENMRWGNEGASNEDILDALKIAQANALVAEKGGLSARVEAGGRNFSGGQKQRLTIARALVKKPEILILDDSASALDFATDAALRVALREARGDTTLFIVSQRAASVMYADKIIVLDDGEAVGMGTHEELLANCAVYREIYDSQFKKEAAE